MILRFLCGFAMLLSTWLGGKAYASEFLIGVTAHILGNHTDPALFIEHAQASGMNSIRVEPLWSAVEQEKGIYAFPPELMPLQEAVDRSVLRGFRPLVILNYGNQFYDRGSYPVSEEAQAAFARYAQYIATRLKGKVRIYEVWNEWNAGTGFPSPPPFDKSTSARHFARLVGAANAAIKQVDPDATVLIGGLGYRDLEWLLEVVGNAGAHYDGIAMHPYNFADGDGPSGDGNKPEEVARWLDNANERIFRKTGRLVPFYITEIGWPDHIGASGISQAAVAQYVARMLLLASSRAYVRGVWWYGYQDDGSDPHDPEHHFGLVNKEGVPKPALHALRATASLIKSADRPRSCQTDEFLSCLVFTGGDNRLTYVLWSPRNVELVVAVLSDGPSTDISAQAIITPADRRTLRTGSGSTGRIRVSGMPVVINGGGPDLRFEVASRVMSPAR